MMNARSRHVVREHITTGIDCWCRPACYRVCDEAHDPKTSCWKCTRGLILLTHAEASALDEPLVVVHNDYAPQSAITVHR